MSSVDLGGQEVVVSDEQARQERIAIIRIDGFIHPRYVDEILEKCSFNFSEHAAAYRSADAVSDEEMYGGCDG